MNSAIDKTKVRTMILRMVSGAVVGAAVTGLFLTFVTDLPDFSETSRLVAVIAGLTYGLMGLAVGVGTLAPRLGATFLNVEDANEISEDRRALGPGAIVCLLAGLLFFALALAPAGHFEGALPRDIAAGTVAVSFAALVGVSLWMRRYIDELNRALGIEASASAMNLSFLLFGGWAALAHLGYAQWITPLGLLSGLALVQLAAIFWVVGRRGMLMPR